MSASQRNDTLRKLLAECDVPQFHLLAAEMAPIMHGRCPNNCQDIVGWLPDDMAVTVLSFLDPVSLCRAARVSRRWHELCRTPHLWKRLVKLPEFRLSVEGEQEQSRLYRLSAPPSSPSDELFNWRTMLAERFRLRSNWLHGRCAVRTFTGHGQSITCIQLDASRIASGSSDCTIKVWSTKTNAPWSVLTLHGHLDSVRCLQMRDKALVSGSNDRTIRVWDLADGPGWSRGSCRLTITGHSDTVRCLQYDGTRIISGSYDATLKIWDAQSGQCRRTLRGHDGAVLAVFFDDVRIISGGIDKLIKIWSFEGHCLASLQGHHGGVTCIQFSLSDRKIFSGSLDGDLRFWSIDTGQCLDTLNWTEGHAGVIRQIQVDHWRVVSASDDKTVKVWDVHTGARLVTLRCHSDGATSALLTCCLPHC